MPYRAAVTIDRRYLAALAVAGLSFSVEGPEIRRAQRGGATAACEVRSFECLPAADDVCCRRSGISPYEMMEAVGWGPSVLAMSAQHRARVFLTDRGLITASATKICH
jgi:hypothetical protein